ncbi:MAG: hypothetical protein PHS57_09485 [Alphaproteobacteria bacterium]|nr:hypothetical protein [Alphaproteobacteria bacterium]
MHGYDVTAGPKTNSAPDNAFDGALHLEEFVEEITLGKKAKAEELFLLAKEAHRKLLKQKMMAAFEAKIGKKMDRVAALAVETALVYMQDKMKEKNERERFDQNLMEIFLSEQMG